MKYRRFIVQLKHINYKYIRATLHKKKRHPEKNILRKIFLVLSRDMSFSTLHKRKRHREKNILRVLLFFRRKKRRNSPGTKTDKSKHIYVARHVARRKRQKNDKNIKKYIERKYSQAINLICLIIIISNIIYFKHIKNESHQ